MVTYKKYLQDSIRVKDSLKQVIYMIRAPLKRATYRVSETRGFEEHLNKKPEGDELFLFIDETFDLAPQTEHKYLLLSCVLVKNNDIFDNFVSKCIEKEIITKPEQLHASELRNDMIKKAITILKEYDFNFFHCLVKPVRELEDIGRHYEEKLRIEGLNCIVSTMMDVYDNPINIIVEKFRERMERTQEDIEKSWREKMYGPRIKSLKFLKKGEHIGLYVADLICRVDRDFWALNNSLGLFELIKDKLDQKFINTLFF